MKRRGFTLIELLAVIVILSVIALIATPIVLKIIDTARQKSRVQSANGVLNSAKYFYTESLLDETIIYPSEGFEFICNGIQCKATIGTTSEEEGISMLSDSATYTLKFNGQVPSSGSIVLLDNGTVTPKNLAIDSHVCTYDEKKNVFTEC